ncbi:hypothetical protein TUMEXPCC7403_21950 [Tumidithrix helvetica PCC 7403]|uniref:hypothetical protein n=1 Tax=Tumidithrix helvetica TaxID=3457545 RepID=UPI003C88834C
MRPINAIEKPLIQENLSISDIDYDKNSTISMQLTQASDKRGGLTVCRSIAINPRK